MGSRLQAGSGGVVLAPLQLVKVTGEAEWVIAGDAKQACVGGGGTEQVIAGTGSVDQISIDSRRAKQENAGNGSSEWQGPNAVQVQTQQYEPILTNMD